MVTVYTSYIRLEYAFIHNLKTNKFNWRSFIVQKFFSKTNMVAYFPRLQNVHIND